MDLPAGIYVPTAYNIRRYVGRVNMETGYPAAAISEEPSRSSVVMPFISLRASSTCREPSSCSDIAWRTRERPAIWVVRLTAASSIEDSATTSDWRLATVPMSFSTRRLRSRVWLILFAAERMKASEAARAKRSCRTNRQS